MSSQVPGVYSKRRAFWSLNEDILKITILKTNTPYPSRKIRRIRACTHQRPQKIKDQYAVSRGLNTPYSRYGINIIFWKISNVVPTPRNPQYAVSNTWIRRDLDNSTINVLIPLDGWTSGLLMYRLPLSVIQLVLWIVDSRCSKYMTSNLQLLRNFIEKFMRTVRFRNDHFSTITRYGDYVQGDDFLIDSCDSNFYTISFSEMAASSLVCLMYKATSTKSWLWHHMLSHLNFGTINQLTSKDLVDGLPKFKYKKDHLCSACEQGKSKRASLSPKLVPSTESKLILLHMDLCGPMRVTKKLREFYAKLGIVYKTSIACTPQQNGIVERRNRTLVEAARTMLIFSKSLEFLWAEAIATACFTQDCSIVHTRYNKTPYELIRRRKPNIQYVYVFGSLCYPTNDCDDLGKMKPKADIGIVIGYSESSRGFHIYNRRTKKIMEMIYVKFDELTTMAFELTNNSAANTLDNENTSSSSSIIVEKDEAPQIVSSSAEQVTNEPNSPVLNENTDELIQEDDAEFDGNVFFNAPHTPMFEEAESSSTCQDPSNMHEFQ
ncbi:retrovirus-related pol polyprotein from transposon TNT 1-94 [Tanacetum coccineum]